MPKAGAQAGIHSRRMPTAGAQAGIHSRRMPRTGAQAQASIAGVCLGRRSNTLSFGAFACVLGAVMLGSGTFLYLVRMRVRVWL